MYKIIAIFILIFGLINSNFAQSKKKKTIKKILNSAPQITENTEIFKVLASGDKCIVDLPFIFVARDKETYKLLQNLIEKLPYIDFEKNAVVAFFAGKVSESSYTISVQKNTDGKIFADASSSEKKSLKIPFSLQPYKIVSVPIEEEKAIQIEPTKFWQKQMQNYQIVGSIFNYSGGFAGIYEDFQAEGNIGILRFKSLVTFLFNIKGKNQQNHRLISEISSGTLTNHKILLSRLDAGTFADSPKPPMKVIGKLEKKLLLKFEPLPTIVSDGFAVRGELEAVLAK